MILDEPTLRKTAAPWRVAGLAIAFVAIIAGAAWLAVWHAASPPQGVPEQSSQPGTAKVSGSVTLVVSGDTAGWIVPCGCTSNQSGGLLRRGTYVAELRQAGPVIVADAGGAPGGTSTYQRTRFEAILDGEMAMGLAAHNIGEPELLMGLEYLQKLALETRIPFISANLCDRQHHPVFDPYRIVKFVGLRVALIGVLQRSGKLPATSECEIIDPRRAVLETLASIQGKFDRAIVLAHAPEAELRALAAELPEVDAVIGGPTGQSLAPVHVGPTLVASATNKGKFLVRLSLPVRGAAAQATAEVVEMSSRFVDDPAQVNNVREFRHKLDARDFAAADTGFADAVPANVSAGYRIAGTESCRTCHAGAFGTWHGTNHAHAWETLVKDETHVDPFCQQCHTTGYGLPGGFQSRAKSQDRISVGCESCHGPSLAHVEKPDKHTPFAAREQCTRCHDHENSPEFEFAAYWKQVIHRNETKNDER